jgi:Nidogen-like
MVAALIALAGLLGHSGLSSRIVHAQGNAMVQVPVSATNSSDACGANTPARNDDDSTGQISLPFTANFLGHSYSSLWVNNNGNVTFDGPLSTYTPFNLYTTGSVIIAPFFADVDTRIAGSVVTYGSGIYNGHATFCVNWPGVDYYYSSTSHTKLDYFQVLLVDRSDIAPGDFDIYFNENQIQWETGDASGGTNGLGGSSARVGYSNGTSANSYELPGSGAPGSFLDSNTTLGLIHNSRGSDVLGRYIFSVRNGAVNVGPTVSASGKNADGTVYTSSTWTRQSVNVTLNASVKSITYSATGAQSIAPTTVNAATANVPTITAPGTTTITYHATDTNGTSSSDQTFTVDIFAYPTTGQFVLGDAAVARALVTNPAPAVTFWSPLWAKFNPLTSAPLTVGPQNFRGWASAASASPPVCGGTWTAAAAYQSPAPSSVPSYMGVVVSSIITETPVKITGNITRIVIVKTNPGYSNAQGRYGTGVIVGTVCGP